MKTYKLNNLKTNELKSRFDLGKCPDLKALNGIAQGIIITPKWFKILNIWRGKVFHHSQSGEVFGFNRIGIGSLEILKYHFTTRLEQSLFDNKKVLIIDHNHLQNPKWVRRYHDEAIEIAPHVYLAKSYYPRNGKLRLVSYFVLDFR